MPINKSFFCGCIDLHQPQLQLTIHYSKVRLEAKLKNKTTDCNVSSVGNMFFMNDEKRMIGRNDI